LEQQIPLPLIDHGTPEELGAYVPLLFPNLGLSATEGSWSTFHVIPIAADKTVVETRTKVMPASDWELMKQSVRSWWNWKGKSRAKFDAGEDDPLSSGDFMAEDVYVCEQQFKAMHSPKFAVGALAGDLEQSVLTFQKALSEFVALQ
jgi:Rieske 2Fe-2S family protein